MTTLTDLIISTERGIARHGSGPVGDQQAYRAKDILLHRRLAALKNAVNGTMADIDCRTLQAWVQELSEQVQGCPVASIVESVQEKRAALEATLSPMAAAAE